MTIKIKRNFKTVETILLIEIIVGIIYIYILGAGILFSSQLGFYIKR